MGSTREIRLNVNGREHWIQIDRQTTLLTFLRDQLGFTGTKNGCHGKGQCGACTVLVNGEAKRSCLLKVDKLDGAKVETIESLAQGDELHPLQQAFLVEGAVQCGFCTPGMIMASKGLLDKNSQPSSGEIKQALKHNLCRCTGYTSIIRAVGAAAQSMKDTESRDKYWKQSGIIRQDGRDKVTGRARYADDMREENMLYGKLLLSEYPHAKILSIDTSLAAAAEGVVAVLTARDIPGSKIFGLHKAQQPVLAEDKVRYMGDPVAVVYAKSQAQAEAAVGKIKVIYQPLPGVFDPVTGMRDDAPQLVKEGNVLCHTKVRKGNIDQGFAEADVIVEGNYFTPMVEHAYLETESAIAKKEPDGSIVVHTCSQSSFAMRDAIAASLDLPKEKVRVILSVTGGAFGGKEEPTVQIHCALGALVTGLPVKMTLTREESIRISTKRHAEHIYMRHGATRDGRLVAFESRAICDAGAYISLTGAVVFRSAVVASGPYEIPHAKTDAFGVYTNNNPGGAFRGFGSTQVAFASEVQMDKLARTLNMDPIEFRLKNALSERKATITGQILCDGIGFIETLHAIREALHHIDRKGRGGGRVGIGIASAYKNVGIGTGKSDGADAIVELRENGRFVVRIGATENGQGSDMAMALIAAKTLGVRYDLIDVWSSDTWHTPDGGVTTASRQTFVSGNAVKFAAKLLREKIMAFARDINGDGSCALAEDGALTAGSTCLSPSDLFRQATDKGVVLTAHHHYDPPETYPLRAVADHEPGVDPRRFDIHYAYCFGTQAAVVEVNESSGEVTVLKVIAAQDAGKAIHPQSVKGQIEGAVMMGVGFALAEQYIQKEGLVVTDSLAKLKVPSILQAPEITPIIVEKAQTSGPFGAKGMGEVPINPTAPAILNAIYDAIGVRIDALPATREKILAALRQRDQAIAKGSVTAADQN